MEPISVRVVFFKRLRKAVKIFVILLLGIAGWGHYIYFSGKDLLKQRHKDMDGDGVANSKDGDVDGDGLQNMRDPDADGDGVPNIEDALKAARKLMGRPYDQLMGEKDNIGFRLGGLVCVDVITIAYEHAGIYFEKELRDYYRKYPKVFSYRSWNNPHDGNFARRTRNFRSYFFSRGMILKKREPLRPGDIVIFGAGHMAMIEKVNGGDYTVLEASGLKVISQRASKADIMKRSLERYGDVIYARMKFE